MEKANVSLSDHMIEKLIEKVNKRTTLNEIECLKFRLGISMAVTNISKMIVVYSIAQLCHLFLPVLVFHIGFLLIRTHSYGCHAKSSQVCTLFSVIVFLGCAKLCMMITLPIWLLGLISLGTSFLLSKYAPGVTAKNKLRSEEKKARLKKRTLISNQVVFIMGLLLSQIPIGGLLMVGAFIAALLVTPVGYKILGDERVC